MIVNKFVQSLPEHEKHEIIYNWEEFKEVGYIGECMMRSKTCQMLEESGIPNDHITRWMEMLVFEVLKSFYDQNYRSVV